jgi:hypothetical protein
VSTQESRQVRSLGFEFHWIRLLRALFECRRQQQLLITWIFVGRLFFPRWLTIAVMFRHDGFVEIALTIMMMLLTTGLVWIVSLYEALYW